MDIAVDLKTLLDYLFVRTSKNPFNEVDKFWITGIDYFLAKMQTSDFEGRAKGLLFDLVNKGIIKVFEPSEPKVTTTMEKYGISTREAEFLLMVKYKNINKFLFKGRKLKNLLKTAS